jgi:hypothetical protein
MNEGEIISRIIKLESEIIQRIISDKGFKSCIGDEYQKNRDELELLREKVKHIIYLKSCLPDGIDPQRPDYESLQKWKDKFL